MIFPKLVKASTSGGGGGGGGDDDHDNGGARTLHVAVQDRFHQFRNESEVEKESKGGFICAEIHLPTLGEEEQEEEEAELELSLAAAEEEGSCEENPFGIHPNLLYLAGKFGEKKVMETGNSTHPPDAPTTPLQVPSAAFPSRPDTAPSSA